MAENELPEQMFVRQDETADELFYAQPRLVTHIDDATIDAITAYYSEVIPEGSRVLDLMSSWISHLPPDATYEHVAGLGMNQHELAQNPRLDDRLVHNLNSSPQTPYPDNNFDAVLIAVSVQYLTRPLEVFHDVARILKPGGQCLVAMSHRLFPSKAIYAFHVLAPDDRCRLVGSYLATTEAFEEVFVVDRSPPDADPLWIVHGKLIG